jgi:hypothetical protein
VTRSRLHTIIVEDAVGDRAALPDATSLFDIDAMCGDVVGLDDALGSLAASPRRAPES